MRPICAVLFAGLSLSSLGGCAHQAAATPIFAAGTHTQPIGERRGDSIYFASGQIAGVSEDNHVRLPSFDDAYLVGDQLYVSPPASQSVVRAPGPSGARSPSSICLAR